MGVTFNRFTCTALITTLFIQLLFCSSPQNAGGVETTNGVTVSFKKNQIWGTAPAGSRIVLCDTLYAVYSKFEPFTELFNSTVFSDDYCNFRFDSLPDGFYNITARNANADSGTIIRNIRINGLSSKEIRKSSDYAALGSITGRVYLDSQSVSFALISVMGTDLIDTADGQGNYSIEKVPRGVYKITGSFFKIMKPDSLEYYLVNVDNVTVPENVNVDVNLNLERIH